MPKALCPNCDRLVGITPDKPIAEGFSARYWKIENHDIAGKDTGAIVVEYRCVGSGKLV